MVLPYRWGTHSGLLEAAHDLGTPTLAPAFGGYADQGAHVVDAADLAGSVAPGRRGAADASTPTAGGASATPRRSSTPSCTPRWSGSAA